MRQDIECNLCGYVIHGEDNPFEQRKNRHRDFHKLGRENGVNRIKGKVVWITKW